MELIIWNWAFTIENFIITQGLRIEDQIPSRNFGTQFPSTNHHHLCFPSISQTPLFWVKEKQPHCLLNHATIQY